MNKDSSVNVLNYTVQQLFTFFISHMLLLTNLSVIIKKREAKYTQFFAALYLRHSL